MSIEVLENTIGYNFTDKSLMETALTHSSYKRENPEVKHDNERLEFIGDGVLDAIIGTWLYRKLPDVNEGTLTKMRALIVCERSLSRAGRAIGLNHQLRLGVGERHTGGESKDSIIADAMEALIGAVFIDSGYDTANELVLRLLDDIIGEALAGKLFSDYKSEFQEAVQRTGDQPVIEYITDRTEGPDHKKTFFVHVEVSGENYGSGSGRSKKEAGQNAAKAALDKLRGR